MRRRLGYNQLLEDPAAPLLEALTSLSHPLKAKGAVSALDCRNPAESTGPLLLISRGP